jgi:hypothetical protein
MASRRFEPENPAAVPDRLPEQFDTRQFDTRLVLLGEAGEPLGDATPAQVGADMRGLPRTP